MRSAELYNDFLTKKFSHADVLVSGWKFNKASWYRTLATSEYCAGTSLVGGIG